MNQYEPFIEDPVHAGELDGQRFVVLRIPGDVARRYDELRHAVRQRLSSLPVSYPARAHVTLVGFAAGAELAAVQDVVRAWARGTRPLSLEVERASTFPPPFQIVFVQVRKTPELFAALTRLRRAAEDRRIHLSTPVPTDEWISHVSLAYCPGLGAQAWEQVARFVETLPAPDATAVVREAEVVAFDNGREHSGGVFSLIGSNSSDTHQ